MRTINNAETTIDNGGKKMKYSDLAVLCVNFVDRNKGLDISEMRKRMKIVDVLESSGDTITLEDAEYEHLKRLVNDFRWASMHRDVVAFVDEINKAT